MDQRPKIEDVENHVATAMEDGCLVALGGCQRAEETDAGRIQEEEKATSGSLSRC